MNSSNTYTESMQLGSLRGTPVYDELTKYLRQFSLLISPESYLGKGGSGILVKYKGRVGILTATHVMVDDLDSKKYFHPLSPQMILHFFIMNVFRLKVLFMLILKKGCGVLLNLNPTLTLKIL